MSSVEPTVVEENSEEISNFRTALANVTAALLDDPSNTELIELKRDLDQILSNCNVESPNSSISADKNKKIFPQKSVEEKKLENFETEFRIPAHLITKETDSKQQKLIKLKQIKRLRQSFKQRETEAKHAEKQEKWKKFKSAQGIGNEKKKQKLN